MSKPVELIIANHLHDCAALYEAVSPEKQAVIITDPNLTAMLARDVLFCLISQGDQYRTAEALAAIGAPTPEQLLQRFHAVLDQRREEAARRGSPNTTETRP